MHDVVSLLRLAVLPTSPGPVIITQLESELPTLDAIVARQWGKSDELAALRSEREALQKRIDKTLKETERKNQPVGEAA